MTRSIDQKKSPASAPDESAWTVDWLLLGADGNEFELKFEAGRPLAVGRDFTSDIPLQDAGVSRHHATISLEEGGLWVEDLHSQNGTFVNGRRIRRAEVREGDIVTFGRLHCTLLGRRRRQDRGAEVLRPLSNDDLSHLLELSRKLHSHKDTWTGFHKALEALVVSLGAEQGAILIQDTTREELVTIAAWPPKRFFDLQAVAREPTVTAALRSGRARDLGRAPAEGSRWHRTGSPQLAAPVVEGSTPLGLIYLARAPLEPPFHKRDLDMLAAFAWISEATFAELRASESAMSRLGTSPAAAPGTDAAAGRLPADVPAEDIGRIVENIARDLRKGSKRLEEKDRPPGTADILRAWLCADALRLLLQGPQHPRDRCALRASLEALSEDYGISRDSWRLRGGETVEVFAPADSFRIVLALLIASRISSTWGGAVPRQVAGAVELAPESEGGRVLIRLAPPPEAASPHAALLELAGKLANRHLEGPLRQLPSGVIELEVPEAVDPLHDTVRY